MLNTNIFVFHPQTSHKNINREMDKNVVLHDNTYI